MCVRCFTVLSITILLCIVLNAASGHYRLNLFRFFGCNALIDSSPSFLSHFPSLFDYIFFFSDVFLVRLLLLRTNWIEGWLDCLCKALPEVGSGDMERATVPWWILISGSEQKRKRGRNGLTRTMTKDYLANESPSLLRRQKRTYLNGRKWGTIPLNRERGGRKMAVDITNWRLCKSRR